VEPTTEAMNGAEQTTSSGMTWLWWVIGLLLVTGAGAGALLWLSRRTQGR
jgi:flagellar basal body-associated protein FliL